jgi:hypothetical protein
MRLIAGVDMGNSTTEIVIADADHEPPRPVAWDRTPTRGSKGSVEAAQHAARLLTRLERRSGVSPALAVLTPQAPVRTCIETVSVAGPSLGPLRILGCDPASPAGAGVAIGEPVSSEDPTPLGRPVVMVARDPLGYLDTVAALERWVAAGADVRGVLLSGNEARLVQHRLSVSLPIVDQVDADEALACSLVLLEVAPGPVQSIVDPLFLMSALELDASDRAPAAAAAALVSGARCAVIGVGSHQGLPRAEPARLDPASDGEWADSWSVSIDDLAAPTSLRRAGSDRLVATSRLAYTGQPQAQVEAFADACSVPVEVVGDEPSAAALGARTTPGCDARALVVDLGGGTVDLIADQAATAAGSGELLTTCVGALASISRGTAEWVKRAPAVRFETPHVMTTESSTREFAPPNSPATLAGWLAVPGPAGYLPFARDLGLGEWRALRLAAKRAVIEGNVRRLADRLPIPAATAVAVGGPVGDEEILETLANALPGLLIGRGNVAGLLGHRYAVAYGLVLLVSGGTQAA